MAPGLRARLRAASRVLDGADTPVTITEPKSLSHGFDDPAAPVYAMQVLSRFASALIFGAGDLPVAGNPVPSAFPPTESARLAAVANAFARPFAFVDVDPMLPPGARNCESAQTEATVVTSFTENCVVVVVDSWPHAPITVTRAMLAFAGAELTWPPRATRYSIEDDELQFNPEEIA